MPGRPRRNHTPVFKSKVALAAIKGDKTATELSQQFDVHPNQITQWKTQLLDRGGIVFEGGAQKESPPIDLKALHAKIGELMLDNDFFKRCAQQSRPAERKTMIDRTHRLSITRQTEALVIARSTVYALPGPIPERDLQLMRRMDIEALQRKPRSTRKHPQHRLYPYLLRGLPIDRPNQVWAMELTYIPMARGFVYLVAVPDWYSRKVLSWRVSITMDVHFCLEALEEAIALYGPPEIMNTDQGSQFTSQVFTDLLKERGIRISMDGKGSWRDNVFIERLWRSVTYEEVYLHACDAVSDSRTGLARYFDLYNRRRPHSSLNRKTPDQDYFSQQSLTLAA